MKVIILVSNKRKYNDGLGHEIVKFLSELSAFSEIIFFHHSNILLDDLTEIQAAQQNKIEIKPYSFFSFLRAQMKSKFIFHIDPVATPKKHLSFKSLRKFHFSVLTKSKLEDLNTPTNSGYTLQIKDITQNPKALKLLLNQLNQKSRF